MSCNQQTTKTSIQSGDILFRGTSHAGLSEAINKVTQTDSSTNYTHIGVCEMIDDTVWVYHSAPEKGVCREPLELFCQPDTLTSYVVDQYRLKQEYQGAIKGALIQADRHIGEQYDYSYIIESKGYYCSEFIYEIFEKDSIFKLNPMTFVDPDTREFHQGWVSHYNSLGIEIPEGQPGCNPNEMAVNSKLKLVKRIYDTTNLILLENEGN